MARGDTITEEVPIRKGKVKEVYDRGDSLQFKFTDQISVFDKVIPSMIPHKGASLCATSIHWFDSTSDIVDNHFISHDGPGRMTVRKFDVISDYSKIDGSTTNYLIPLEFICRHYAAGSLLDRLNSGKVDPTFVGFPAGHTVKYGEPLPEPFFEVTTKLEEIDRNLGLEEALDISGLSMEEYEHIREVVLKMDEVIAREVGGRELIHVDGKKEFAFGPERELVVIDTFGTADEDRFWDSHRYDLGEHVELSKEYVRRFYRDTSYHATLMEARDSGVPMSEEPPIPPLPDEMVEKVSNLYLDMYNRLTGKMYEH